MISETSRLLQIGFMLEILYTYKLLDVKRFWPSQSLGYTTILISASFLIRAPLGNHEAILDM